jgi:exonuclease SbcD
MGGVGGSEQSMALGRDHVLQRSALALPGVDYVALGHLHRRQAIGGGAPPVVYAGSLQRVDFGEEAEEKGFCVVEIVPSPSRASTSSARTDGTPARAEVVEAGLHELAGPSTGSGRTVDGRGDPPGRPYGARDVRWEFVAVKARSFVTVDVKLDADEPSPTQRVLEAIGRKHVKDAVVRVRIAGPEAAVRGVDERAVRQALASAHHVAAIARDVARGQRPRLGVAASSLTPEEALRRYLETRQGASEAVRARALEAGRQLIQEEQARERG